MKNTFPITLGFRHDARDVIGTGEVEIRDNEILVSGVINADCTQLADPTMWAGELIFFPNPVVQAPRDAIYDNEDHIFRGEN